jgi:hypothetical protein
MRSRSNCIVLFTLARCAHGELLRLGIAVAQSTVSVYMIPRRDRPLQTWKTFLRNHMEGIASIDLFVVPTIAFRQLFAFLVRRPRRAAKVARPSGVRLSAESCSG